MDPSPRARCFAASTPLAALALAACLMPGAFAQSPAITGSRFVDGDGGEPARLDLDVASEPLSRVGIVHSSTLEGAWREVAPPVVATGPLTPLSVPLADFDRKGFFRAVVSPPRVKVAFEKDEIILTIEENDVGLDEVLVALGRLLGREPFFALPYDPEDERTHPYGERMPTLKPGVHRGPDLAHLSESLGLRLWDESPERDDPRIADLYVPLKPDVGEPIELPGDGGKGEIDQGWEGDDIREQPELIDPDKLPEPGSFDMPYDPREPDESKDPQSDELPGERGNHLRVRLAYDGIDFFFERALVQDTGSALLDKPFPMPAEGSFVLAVWSPKLGIYHLMPFEDPRFQRAYLADDEGGHSNEMMPRGIHRISIPLGDGSVAEALEGLQATILTVKGTPEGGPQLLTPELLERHPDLFPMVGGIAGNDLAKLIGEPGRAMPEASTRDPEVTLLHRSGTNATKFNIAVVGEGFRDTTADQNLFNDYVEERVMRTLRERDIHPTILNGINLFRVNTFSEQSGVTTVNADNEVITARSTALEYRYSGLWNRCWMRPGPNSEDLLESLVDDFCPQADYVIIVLNVTGPGGCARSSHFAVTRSAGWAVVAHEFGHKPGSLGDEYTCATTCGCYGDGEPSRENLTSNTTRATLKWNIWVPSWRPIPTTAAQIADTSQDVGLFPGATIGQNQWTSCIFRPSLRGRMNNNTPLHNPVGHTNVREQFRPYQKANFYRNAVGDFDGDGRADVVLLDDRQLSLFLSRDRDVGPDDPVRGSPPRGLTGVLEPTWFATGIIRNDAETRSWQVRNSDILRPGDFDGDGLTDLYIINLDAWNKPYLVMMRSHGDHFQPVRRYDGNLPGWQMRAGDRYRVGDFTGDGRDDLMVYNGTGWSIPYFAILRSTGTSLQMVRRYDRFLPGWEMGRHEEIHVGDFNGDGRAGIATFNKRSWSQVHLMVFNPTSTGLSLAYRRYGTIPGFWQMRRNDNLHVLDFTGDGQSDLAIFNGRDWGPVYLGYLESRGGVMTGRRRYDSAKNPVPGWQLQRRDRFYPANVNGNELDDLVVYNKDNWNTQYLGILRTNPGQELSITGSWQANWINGWNLGPNDQFRVADFRGSGGWDDLFVFNSGWFGMLRGYRTHFRLETIYRKWIHNHRYHGHGWW